MSAVYNRLMSVARRTLPPRIKTALRILVRRPPITYSRAYPSWIAAKRDAVGYGQPAILEAIRTSALAVKEGRAVYEKDSIAHAKPAFRWPLLACLLHAALHENASSGRPFHVLDFGGSLGSLYFQHLAFLDSMPALLWSVVELPDFVRTGNAEFADERLHYFNTIKEVAGRAPIDAAIFSGSLEYLDAPYAVLEQIAAAESRYLILDRLHLTTAAEDEIKLQHTKPPLYVAKLAVRFFATRKLLTYLGSIGYGLIAALPDNGFFFERKPAASQWLTDTQQEGVPKEFVARAG